MPVNLTREDLDEMLDRAVLRGAEEGAKRALAHIGLHDEKAGDDVKDLRRLLMSFRGAKRVVVESVLNTLTKAILIGMAVVVAAYMKVEFFSKH
jgi:hypothetical protein